MGYFEIINGEGPVIGAAIHSGHEVSENVLKEFLISEEDRLREEDPFTDEFISFLPVRIIGRTSRFEVDLNRPPEKAVYLNPEDAWGLNIWENKPSESTIKSSMDIYNKFYSELRDLIQSKISKHGKIFIYDVHSYNHRRNGPGAEPDDPSGNPEVNIGTGNIDSEYWRKLINDFIMKLSEFGFPGGKLDVRENVKFSGGHFSKWINENFRNDVCILSIEFKKIFMDEWTGKRDNEKVSAITEALRSTLPAVCNSLKEKGAVFE